MFPKPEICVGERNEAVNEKNDHDINDSYELSILKSKYPTGKKRVY